jgi:hypothetical protein
MQGKGAWTKVLCKQPTKEIQKDIGEQIMILPFSPINGTILIRSGQVPIDHFNAEFAEQSPYPRAIFVPLDMPVEYEHAVKSAAHRALGPSRGLLEKSGVSFSMQTIGVRAQQVKGDELVVDESDLEGHQGMANAEEAQANR